jgi:hypothetical protein
MDLNEMRRKNTFEKTRYYSDDIQNIFKEFGLSQTGFKKINNEIFGYCIFEINSKKIEVLYTVSIIIYSFFIDGKKMSCGEAFDILFLEMNEARKNEYLNIYLNIDSNNILIQLEDKINEMLNNKLKLFFQKELIFKKVIMKDLDNYCAEFSIETKDETNEYKLYSGHPWLESVLVKIGESEDTNFSKTIHKDLENKLLAENIYFPDFFYVDDGNLISELVIKELMQEEYEKTKEYKLRKLYNPNFSL